MRLAKHEKTKKILKIVGIIVLVVGLALTIAGFANFFKHMANQTGEMPKLFFLAFIGLPMMAIGGMLMIFGFRRELLTYVKNESVPVINEASEDLSPAIKNVAQSARADAPEEKSDL